jgi:hypothetical protein
MLPCHLASLMQNINDFLFKLNFLHFLAFTDSQFNRTPALKLYLTTWPCSNKKLY